VANPTCPHCNNNAFELHEAGVAGSKRRVLMLQCAKCGTPFGTRDVFDYGALLLEQDTRIKAIEHQMALIATQLSHIGRIVTGLANQHTI